MKSRIVLTPLARADVEEAQAWYEAKREGLGDRFVGSADDAFQKIAQDPTRFAPVVEDVRSVLIEDFPYGVYNRVEPNGSVVIACLHGKRSPDLAHSRALGRRPGRRRMAREGGNACLALWSNLLSHRVRVRLRLCVLHRSGFVERQIRYPGRHTQHEGHRGRGARSEVPDSYWKRRTN